MTDEDTIRARLTIACTWDGGAATPGERVAVEATFGPEILEILVDAPFHGDPPPPVPGGPTPRLWDYEVVELFLLGRDERYLELEFGPHGHYLALELRGPRNTLRDGMPLSYEARVRGDRWTGTARVPNALLPPGVSRWNAYAIHGEGVGRRYLCHSPTGGSHPDFHRLDAFVPIVSASDPGRGSGSPR